MLLSDVSPRARIARASARQRGFQGAEPGEDESSSLPLLLLLEPSRPPCPSAARRAVQSGPRPAQQSPRAAHSFLPSSSGMERAAPPRRLPRRARFQPCASRAPARRWTGWMDLRSLGLARCGAGALGQRAQSHGPTTTGGAAQRGEAGGAAAAAQRWVMEPSRAQSAPRSAAPARPPLPATARRRRLSSWPVVAPAPPPRRSRRRPRLERAAIISDPRPPPSPPYPRPPPRRRQPRRARLPPAAPCSSRFEPPSNRHVRRRLAASARRPGATVCPGLALPPLAARADPDPAARVALRPARPGVVHAAARPAGVEPVWPGRVRLRLRRRGARGPRARRRPDGARVRAVAVSSTQRGRSADERHERPVLVHLGASCSLLFLSCLRTP